MIYPKKRLEDFLDDQPLFTANGGRVLLSRIERRRIQLIEKWILEVLETEIDRHTECYKHDP